MIKVGRTLAVAGIVVLFGAIVGAQGTGPTISYNEDLDALTVDIPNPGENMKEIEIQKKDGSVWKNVRHLRRATTKANHTDKEAAVKQGSDEEPLPDGDYRAIITRINWSDSNGDGRAHQSEMSTQRTETTDSVTVGGE